jgi:hypothetical protein
MVDPEPLILGNLAGDDEIDIVRTLDNTNAPSWTFATNGIVIKSPGVHFSDNHGSGAGKQHSWKRRKKNNKRFVYTINVENIADGTALSWDPRVINN